MNNPKTAHDWGRIAWASAITASAGALTIAFLRNPTMPIGLMVFSVTACMTAVVVWRPLSRRLSSQTSSLLCAILVGFAAIKTIGWIRSLVYANSSAAYQTPEWMGYDARYNALEKAILNQNIGYVRSALNGWPDIDTAPALESTGNQGDKAFQETPLETAVKTGNQQITVLLLDRGASVATPNALTLAVDRGDAAMLHLLIQRGHLPHPLGEFAKAAMFRAVELGDYDSVALLMLAGESRDTDGYCAKYGTLPISLQQLARREGRVPIMQLVGATVDK